MELKVTKKKILEENDHFSWNDISKKNFIKSNGCVLCGDKLEEISSVVNKTNEVGLEIGFCKNCSLLSKTRCFDPKFARNHFAKSWLINRDEKIFHDNSVINLCGEYIVPKSNILDVGCGLGAVLLPFKEAGHNVSGIEPSEHRASIARDNLENIDTGPIENFLHLFENNKYDLVILNDVIQFLFSPFEILDKIIQSLGDDGVLFVKMGSFSQQAPFWQEAHNSVVLHRFSAATFSKWSKKNNVGAKILSHNPLIVIFSKKFESADLADIKSTEINIKSISRFIGKSLSLFRLRFFRKVTLSYGKRSINVEKIPSDSSLLPVRFNHNTSSGIPTMLK